MASGGRGDGMDAFEGIGSVCVERGLGGSLEFFTVMTSLPDQWYSLELPLFSMLVICANMNLALSQPSKLFPSLAEADMDEPEVKHTW